MESASEKDFWDAIMKWVEYGDEISWRDLQ